MLAIIGTILFALKSYRGWRDLHAGRSLRDEFRESFYWFEGPVDFLYFIGLFLSVLFGVTILVVSLHSFYNPVEGQGSVEWHVNSTWFLFSSPCFP